MIQLTLTDSEDDYRTESLNNNRPIQDYVHPDNPTQPTYEMWDQLVKNIPRYDPCFL